VVGRAKILASAGLLVLVATVFAGRLPGPTEDDVRAQLSEALSGAVVEDFVWLPTRGRAGDLLEGRSVAVLAAKPGELADVYVARVALWQGAPLRVVGVEPVLPTSLGRERALVARGTRFAYVVERDGVDETVVLADAAAPQVFALTSDSALGRVEGLGLERGGRAFGLEAPLEELAAHGFVAVDRALPGVHPATLERREAEGVTSFEGEPRSSPVDGHPAIVERGSPSEGLRLFDGRQHTFELLPGWGARSDTGARSRGRSSPGGAVVAAYELVGLAGGGVAGPRLFTIVDATEPVLSARGGELRLGLGSPPDAEVTIPLRSVAPEGDLAALCATRDGHLAMAWSRSRSSADLPDSCEVVATFRGGFHPVADLEAAATVGTVHPALLVRAAERGPRRVGDGEPELVWSPEPLLSSPPPFLPAVSRSETESLGARVTLFQIDATRFDFRWVVGSSEKSHRLGGTFEAGVPPGAAPVRFGIPAGTGTPSRSRRGCSSQATAGSKCSGGRTPRPTRVAVGPAMPPSSP
jgi:hypothetical protein